MQVAGIKYSLPKVFLLQESGLGTSEYAGRCAYNSFNKSENVEIKELNYYLTKENQSAHVLEKAINYIHEIESSDLLNSLAWVHHHHSVIEHCSLTFLVKGISRAVLQEHARHRLQSITVQSTRYTMSPVINAFLTEMILNKSNTCPSKWFIETMLKLDIFVTQDNEYNTLQIVDIFNKLKYQLHAIGEDEFVAIATTKAGKITYYDYKDANDPMSLYSALNQNPQKRNVGDAFKHIVNDMWKSDMVITFNLRSLKNYFGLRDSGAAYFHMRALAKAMKSSTPSKYLDLIVKSK